MVEIGSTDETTGHAGDAWVRTWSAAPQAPDAGLGSLEDRAPFADVTLRQVVRISGGGRRLRVRLTNEYGTGPLIIGAARVGLATHGGNIEAGSARELTFGGRRDVTVPAAAPILSDPIDLPLAALSRLSISLYLPVRVDRCTCHDPSLDAGWVIAGNAVADDTLPGDAGPLPVRAMISAVEVVPDAPAKAVVVLSDSIADGFGSTPDTNRTWPELLAERGGPAFYIGNQGISGNRLLNNGLGAAGLARFDRDVLATPGLGYVVVSLGHNDISISHAPRDDADALAGLLAMFPGDPVTGDDIIAGYRQLIARAHDHGVKIYATTVTPDEGSETHSRRARRRARRSTPGSVRVAPSTPCWTSTPSGATRSTPAAFVTTCTRAITCTATTPATGRSPIRSTSCCSAEPARRRRRLDRRTPPRHRLWFGRPQS